MSTPPPPPYRPSWSPEAQKYLRRHRIEQPRAGYFDKPEGYKFTRSNLDVSNVIQEPPGSRENPYGFDPQLDALSRQPNSMIGRLSTARHTNRLDDSGEPMPSALYNTYRIMDPGSYENRMAALSPEEQEIIRAQYQEQANPDRSYNQYTETGPTDPYQRILWRRQFRDEVPMPPPQVEGGDGVDGGDGGDAGDGGSGEPPPASAPQPSGALTATVRRPTRDKAATRGDFSQAVSGLNAKTVFGGEQSSITPSAPRPPTGGGSAVSPSGGGTQPSVPSLAVTPPGGGFSPEGGVGSYGDRRGTSGEPSEGSPIAPPQGNWEPRSGIIRDGKAIGTRAFIGGGRGSPLSRKEQWEQRRNQRPQSPRPQYT